jgi:hypothetical protein
MTQALSGAAIAAVIAVCWLLGRPRPKILRSTDTTAVAALNRGQMERLLDAPINAADANAPEGIGPGFGADQGQGLVFSGRALSWPRDQRERGLLLRQLDQQFLAGGEARRQAMALCAAWNHRDTLPLIRRGLRDSDPAVVGLAADAMAGFRGRTTAGVTAQPATKPPRNVSRTR